MSSADSEMDRSPTFPSPGGTGGLIASWTDITFEGRLIPWMGLYRLAEKPPGDDGAISSDGLHWLQFSKPADKAG